MCQYTSWKRMGKDVFFLQDGDLKGKTFDDYKKFNANWKEDIYGHGAIEYFYPILKGKGQHEECTDFSTPKNFPDEIAQAIKDCKMTEFRMRPKELLNSVAQVEFEKTCDVAQDERDKVCDVALTEFNKVCDVAQNEYKRAFGRIQPECARACDVVWAKYKRVCSAARAEYKKIYDIARAECSKTYNTTFWNLFRFRENRNPLWR